MGEWGLGFNISCYHGVVKKSDPFLGIEGVRGSAALGGGTQNRTCFLTYHMSYSLNSLNGDYIGDSIGDYYRGY